jgi:hypothetical protein
VIEIKDRFDGKVLFRSYSAETLKDALEQAVQQEINLNWADLDGASLVRASLDGASLVGARLDGASLVGARLDGASLVGARLDGARLDGASLVGARLDGARLVRASLVGARLDGASLVGARLVRANLKPIQDDFDAVLLAAVSEMDGLEKALFSGQVDGSTYSGPCACLVGTIAKVRGCDYRKLDGLTPDASRPIETFFLAIRKGDTPETSQFAALAVDWIRDFRQRFEAAVAAYAPRLGFIKEIGDEQPL